VLLQKILPRVTPSNVEITRRGRVTLAVADTKCGNQCDGFSAPEYTPGHQVTSETSIEKVRMVWYYYLMSLFLYFEYIEHGPG
jgi:hypothetical protein